MKGRLLMAGSAGGGSRDRCASLTIAFLEELADFILQSILRGSMPRLEDVVERAVRFSKLKGGCVDGRVPDSIYVAYLSSELERIGSMLLDKAMEALSKHMELVKNDVHNLLSVILTNYALHEARLVALLQEFIRDYGRRALEGDEFVSSILRTMEEEVYAALARFFAVTRLISKLSPRELEKYARLIADVVDWFMREENNKIIVAAYHVKGILG